MFSRRVLVPVAAGLLTAAAPGSPSDPIGIYAIVDRVVLEPDSISPERIQIWGAFVVQVAPNTYTKAQGGYLYYAANPTNRRATFIEWSDLKTLAGTRRMIGFGGRYAANGRVRVESDKPASPDVYPLGVGIYRDPPIWQLTSRLRDFHSATRVPPPSPPPPVDAAATR